VASLLGLLVYALSFQGSRGLWEPSEGRYVMAAMEMLRLDDWMHPALHHDHPHWTKPPLMYWAIAASVDCLGRTTFAARLPSAMSFVITTLLIYGLGRIFMKRRPWWPALIYATSLFPAAASNVVTTDDLLTLFETAAMWGFSAAYWPGDNRFARLHGARVGWVSMGLAFLVKGPPAWLPLLALLTFHFANRRHLGTVRMWGPWGPIVMLLIGTSWHLGMVAQRPELAGYFLWDEVVLRTASGHHGRNSAWYGPFVVYAPVLLFGTLPWTLTICRVFGGVVRRWFGRGWFSRRRAEHLQPNGTTVDLESRLLLLWIAVPLLVFVVSRSRLPLYLLPLFVPIALIIARHLDPAVLSLRRYRVAVVSVLLLVPVGRLASSCLESKHDSAALAQSIRRLTTSPYKEITFVNTPPYLGLALYLNAESELVQLTEAGAKANGVQTVAEELDEPDGERLWLVPERFVKGFSAEIARHGKRLHPVGRVHARESYHLFHVL
jgi:4-amino-4-deoxy-L-arabinose transferase-like glycosyltransferase